MGGIDASASPFLGAGLLAPGLLTMTSAINTAGTIADVIDSAIAAQALQLISGYANDIRLSNSTGTFVAVLRGTVGLVNMGQ